MEWSSNSREVYLAHVDVRKCRGVSFAVLLITIHIGTQHECQSLAVSFQLRTKPWVICNGEHISSVEYLAYTLREFKLKLHSIVYE